MNQGLYISAMGAATSMHRQDIHANNLANVNTVGFKPLLAAVRQRDVARVEDGLFHLPSNDLLERLGGGVQAMPERVNFAQGSIEVTGNNRDVAIQGEGFLMVRDSTHGDSTSTRLTRDGRLTRNAQGFLVLATTGQPVLDSGNGPIRIPDEAPVKIDADGTITQDGRAIGRLALVSVPNLERVERLGNGLFNADASTLDARRPATGRLVQNAVERSAMNEIDAIMNVTGAGRDAQANITMISFHDRIMDQAINRLGRVS